MLTCVINLKVTRLQIIQSWETSIMIRDEEELMGMSGMEP